MNVGVIFPPSSYSYTAPIHIGSLLSLLKEGSRVSSVKYVDYNETKYYLYEKLIGKVDDRYRAEILGEWSKNLFKSEAILLYERGVLERIMDVPLKNQFTHAIAKNADFFRYLESALVKIFKDMLYKISIFSLDLLVLVPPSPDLYNTLIICYLAKTFDPDIPVMILDYYNFDPSTPYLAAFITHKNWLGEDVKNLLEYDPLYEFLKEKIFSIIDYIVQGEGYDVVSMVSGGSRFSQRINGLAFYKNGISPEKFELNREELCAKKDWINIIQSNPVDFDSVPFPDYRQMQHIYDIAQVEMSRGCFYKCVFCERSPFIPSLRFHSKEYMLKLISSLVTSYKFREYSFFDTSLNLDEERTAQILQYLLDNGVFIKYSAQLRPKIVKEKTLQLMKATGCYEIGIGLESGDERVLMDMEKGSNLYIHKQVIRKILKNGMHLAPYIIFGFPTDTVQSVKNTMKLIRYIAKISKNYDIGMGFYWWGYIQRLSPRSFQKYGIKIHNPFLIKRQLDKISYLLALPGLLLGFEYQKGMRRSEMWDMLREYYKLSDELHFPLYAAEPRPQER